MIKVSCIILCSLNDLFVKKRLIPSIIKNSDMSSTEIIVVDNGPTQDFEYDGVKVIKSDPYHIPKAYNKGVLEAQGKYIALFHDDCELKDNDWINKLTSELNNIVYLVGPEKHEIPSKVYIKSNKNENWWNDVTKSEVVTTFFKEVPIMMERKKFLEIGGYDETYYAGCEDTLLCETILDKGKQIKEVKIKYVHYNGISSTLLGCSDKMRDIIKEKFLGLNESNYQDINLPKITFNNYLKYFNIKKQDVEGGWKGIYKKMPKTEIGAKKFLKEIRKNDKFGELVLQKLNKILNKTEKNGG